jgi:hypothetical protein
MNLKQYDIIVDCKHCVYSSSDGRGVFDITVPIIDSDTGISGPARLRCIVSPERHTIELQEWQPVQSVDKLQQRVSAAFNVVADRQVCGNRNICPSEVIRFVEKNSIS